MEAILDSVSKLQSSSSLSLGQFLEFWDEDYKNETAKIPLFNPELTQSWSNQQKQYFAKVFYHIRGHFHDFLWYMGNHAPNAATKKVILHNMAEEFGLNGRSHEQLYYDFASSLGVNLTQELVDQENYAAFAREFNKEHMRWLSSHSWEENLVAFSAYERLDNIDYVNLYTLAESFSLSKRDLVFFSVHMHVKHFDATLDMISEIWESNPYVVKEIFKFIGQHQINMWKNLSNEIFSFL